MMKKPFLSALLLSAFLWCAGASIASADPISTAIVAVVGLAGTAAAIATAVVTFALNATAIMAINKVFGPGRRNNLNERQASVLALSLGESDCELVIGRTATGGSLVDAFNHGADYEWETLVIALADHELTEIEGFYIGDSYFAWQGNGYDSRFYEDGKSSKPRLYLYEFYNPTSAPSWLVNNSGGRWSAADRVLYKHCVILAYHVSEKVWTAGRPANVRWVVNGKKLYNPAKDSTVPGGSGAHRWGDESTYEYDDNAQVAAYNWRRGLWANGQLLVGPGRSAEEAPPEDAIPLIAICNETVTLKAGGTERRYRAAGVIRSSDQWSEVERNFADAMAGQVVDRNGSVFAEPGYVKTVAATFTDSDLAQRRELNWKPKKTRDQLINTVAAKFPDPDRLFEISSAPIRRSLSDITADREPRELPLELALVPSQTQAQRCAEIVRRKERKQARAVLTLWQKFMPLEVGDWVTWTSARRFAGSSKTFRVEGADVDEAGFITLTLAEIDSTVFAWTAASDELDDDRPAYLPAGAETAATLQSFSAEMIEVADGSNLRPVAMRVSWNAESSRLDSRIGAIKIEFRVAGSTYATPYIIDDEDSGVAILPAALFSDGVQYEARATPIASGPTPLSTAWRTVAPLNLTPKTPPTLAAFSAYQLADGVRFVAVNSVSWPVALELEIRAGAYPETARTIYRGSALTTPVLADPPPADGSNRYWAALVSPYAGGDVFGAWRFVDLDVATLPNRNVVQSFSFQTGDWPGIARGFTRTGIGGSKTLNMDAPGGVRPPYADYFQTVDLGAEINARWFFESLLAGRDPSPPIAYADLALVSYSGLESWIPYATVDPVSEAVVTAYIATDQAPATLIDGAILDGSTLEISGGAAAIASGISYAAARTGQGASISATSGLAYNIALPSTFRVAFEFRPDSAWASDRILWKATTAAGAWARVRYDDTAGQLKFEDSTGGVVSVAAPIWSASVIYTIAISQEAGVRRIAWTYDGGAIVSASASVADVSSLSRVYLADAGAISYEELATYDATELAALSYAELSGDAVDAVGVVANFEAHSGGLTDALIAGLQTRGPAGFSAYREFLPGDYVTRRASIWLRLNVQPGYGEPARVDAAKIIADVPDVQRSGGANILAAGTRINYGVAYNQIPEVVATLTGGVTAVTVKISERDLTGFTATAYNAAGSAVDASISWAALGW